MKDVSYQEVQTGENQVVVPMATNQRVTYTWQNLEVYAEFNTANCCTRMCKKSPPIQKHILHDVSGVAQEGEILAILGASGAGKTTLLNCLTFRRMGKLKLLGQRYLNGTAVNADSLARISGYVQQDDLFVGSLTVKETLRFQALLRMDKHLTYDERMKRVEEVIHELGLTKCADTIIGDPERAIKGISGGEKKRLSFACEVLTNPMIMFCDEPTSGLDSYMALNIIQVLKNLASTGKIVICTIHQPSSEVFAMFDRILLMSEGRTAFLGPTDDALTFFASQGLPCPPNYNPADFFIHSLATIPDQEAESKKRVKEICDAYDVSEYGKKVVQMTKDNEPVVGLTDESDNKTASLKLKRSPYKASWCTQFNAVMWRSWTTVVRESRVIRMKVFQTIFTALLIALIYKGQTNEDILNINGVLFLLLTNITFQHVYMVVNVFTLEQPIFLREHFNGMYRTDVYVICKMLAEFPTHLLYPVIFIAVPYYIIGLNPAVDRFCTAIIIYTIVANVATSFGYWISSMASSVKVASALSAPLIIPLLLFGGFFLNNGSVPIYFQWLRHISWFMYGNEALSINQWRGVSFNETLCAGNTTLLGQICSGEDVLAQLNFSLGNFWRDIACLIVLMFAFRLMAFFTLLKKTYSK